MRIRIRKRAKWVRPLYLTDENSGAGSFLDPPNYVTHFLGIVGGVDRGQGYQEYSSVESYLDDEEVGAVLKEELVKLGFNEEGFKGKLSLESESVKAWIKTLFAYFRNCYAPENLDRNASNCIIDKDNKISADRHLATLTARKHYPSFEPTKNLIESPQNWGTSEYPHIVEPS